MDVRIQYEIRHKRTGTEPIATYETVFDSPEKALSAIASWNRQLKWVYSPVAVSYEPSLMDLGEYFPNTKKVG